MFVRSLCLIFAAQHMITVLVALSKNLTVNKIVSVMF